MYFVQLRIAPQNPKTPTFFIRFKKHEIKIIFYSEMKLKEFNIENVNSQRQAFDEVHQ
jgi:hypothetical protein